MFVSCGGDHGPLMQYYVGDFDGTTFKQTSDASKVWRLDYGDAFYAAIAWRDAPQNKKILLGWLQEGRKETYPWKGQMSIPHDLALKTTDEGLILTQAPSSIITKSLSKFAKGRVLSKTDVSLNSLKMPLTGKGAPTGNSYWIDVEFSVGDAKKLGFAIAEKADGSKKVIVGYDAEKQEIFIDCTASEKGLKSTRNLYNFAPMKAVNGSVKLQVLFDNSSLEIFGNDGEKVISTMIMPDTDATGLSAFSNGKSIIKSLKIYDMSR